MSKLPVEIIEYFEDAAELEVGDFHKHDACFAEKTLDVTQTDVDECPELAPYLGKQLSQSGTNSYNYGWDSYEDIEVYEKVIKQVPEKVIPAHEVITWVKIKEVK